MKSIDITGMTFGCYTALSLCEPSGVNRVRTWMCQCNLCGKEVKVRQSNLSGRSPIGCRSCSSRMGRKRTSHGMADTNIREYRQWRDMRQRCNSPGHNLYPYYGGRGIRIDARWNDFGQFLKDMGPCPEDMTLDRIDNDGNYDPRNCRWAPWSVQARNKRNNVWMVARGKRLIRADWSRLLCIDQRSISRRQEQGWDDEKIVEHYLAQRGGDL